MIKCLYKGPEFIYKVYPISNLTAKFLYDEGQGLVKAIESEQENKVIAVIAEGIVLTRDVFPLGLWILLADQSLG